MANEIQNGRKFEKFLTFCLQENLNPKYIKVSSNLKDAVKVKCQICRTEVLLSDMMHHCTSTHHITLSEYEKLCGSRKDHLIENVSHQCILCSDVLLLDILVLEDHFEKIEHTKSLKEYQKELKYFICDKCSKKYNNEKSLKVHKSRSHNSKSTLECPEKCGTFLTSRGSVKKHLLSHQPRDLWPHQCPLCKKRFQAKGDVTVHLKTRIHQMEKFNFKTEENECNLTIEDNENFVSNEDFEELFKSIDKNISEAKQICSDFQLALTKFQL